MIREYALDPALVTDPATLRLIAASVGIAHGRVIARCPADWANEALRLVHQLSGAVEQQRARELIVHLHNQSGRLRPVSGWNAAHPFTVNAQREYLTRPLDALLMQHNQTGADHILVPDDLLPPTMHARWEVPLHRDVPRSPADMAEVARPLLRMSRSVLFVDPHFRFRVPAGQRFLGPLAAFLALARGPGGCVSWERIEYHTGFGGQGHETADEFRACCAEVAPHFIPAGMTVRFVRWWFRNMHDRFILTERGGLTYGHGLDADDGNPPGTVTVGRLDPGLARRYYTNLTATPGAEQPEPGGGCTVTGTRQV